MDAQAGTLIIVIGMASNNCINWKGYEKEETSPYIMQHISLSPFLSLFEMNFMTSTFIR